MGVAGFALEITGSEKRGPAAVQPGAAERHGRRGTGPELPGEPRVLLDLPDRLVIHKPPRWEVDTGGEDEAEEAGEAQQLSRYLQALAPLRLWPIAHDAGHGHGFVHRLDVICSGLILAAKSYEAYYNLKLQLNSGELVRDYLIVCHGWVPLVREEVDARIYWARGSKSSSVVSPQGKPARTLLKVLGHARLHEFALSLVDVRIDTGRQHQIRAHTAHIGHPTANDARYTSQPAAGADRAWCPRNALHRHHLAFRDGSGARRHVRAPLPPELACVLLKLAARGTATEQELSRWLRQGRREG